jgi:hypothetical protein
MENTQPFSHGDDAVEVNGINDSGVLVGFYWDYSPTGPIHGFILDKGKFTTIDYPGASHTVPQAINNTGEIVGNWAIDNDPREYMFKYKDGKFTEFTVVGAAPSDVGAGGINNDGDISGYYENNKGSYGFILHSNGDLLTIKDPNNPTGTGLTGLNDKLQAVGTWFNDTTEASHGFL